MNLLILLLIPYIFEWHHVTIDLSSGIWSYLYLEKLGIYLNLLQDKVIKLNLSIKTINFFTKFVFVGARVLK
jgi:hypothetical protein